MYKKHRCILVAGLVTAALTACGHAETSASETPATYGISTMSTENSEQEISADSDAEKSAKQESDGSEYEIDDMLPRLSDDTLIMSVEEAEAFMNNKADADKKSSETTNQDR